MQICSVSLRDDRRTHCQREKERERECAKLYSSINDFQQKKMKISLITFKHVDFTLVRKTTCQVTLLNFLRRAASFQINSLSQQSSCCFFFLITATGNKISPHFSPHILYTAPDPNTFPVKQSMSIRRKHTISLHLHQHQRAAGQLPGSKCIRV